jgi:hypothetical protein
LDVSCFVQLIQLLLQPGISPALIRIIPFFVVCDMGKEHRIISQRLARGLHLLHVSRS